jgi:hypothetical protein
VEAKTRWGALSLEIRTIRDLAQRLLYRGPEFESYPPPQRKWRGTNLPAFAEASARQALPKHPGEDQTSPASLFSGSGIGDQGSGIGDRRISLAWAAGRCRLPERELERVRIAA